MRIKLIMILLAVLFIFTGCNTTNSDKSNTTSSTSSTETTETNISNSTEPVSTTDFDESNTYTQNDSDSNTINILSKDLEIVYSKEGKYLKLNESDIKKDKYLSKIHTEEMLSEKSKALSEFITSDDPIVYIEYEETTADFDNDGEDETIISQNWCPFSSREYSRLLFYTYFWLIENENCQEIFYCGLGANAISKYTIDGQSFICWIPEIGKGAIAQDTRCFLLNNGSLVEYTCDDGNLQLQFGNTIDPSTGYLYNTLFINVMVLNVPADSGLTVDGVLSVLNADGSGFDKWHRNSEINNGYPYSFGLKKILTKS